MLRAARDEDLEMLKRHALATDGARRLFVLERNGVIGGAVAVADKPFESEILRCPVAQIEAVQAWDNPDDLPALATGAIEALADAGVALVSCRRPEADRTTLLALQQAGMYAVECLMTFSHPLSGLGEAAETDTAQPTDADACVTVAERAFRFDRFHADPLVDDALADALKGAWVRNSVLGRADRVFVVREAGRIVGFNACMLRDDTAVIDLIGIDPDHQGRGHGRRLTHAALAHYAQRGAAVLKVGTQSANHASLRLYQRAGFTVGQSVLTLHAHLA